MYVDVNHNAPQMVECTCEREKDIEGKLWLTGIFSYSHNVFKSLLKFFFKFWVVTPVPKNCWF